MDDSGDTESSKILNKACQSMVKHAKVSSNLAALSLHVTRMLRQLVRDIQKSNNAKNNQGDKIGDFSERISRVGKARATAGALQLLRLLCHGVVVENGADAASESLLSDSMLYRSRGDLPRDQPTAKPLVHSILDLISIAGQDTSDSLKTPEVYDAVVLSFHLLFVLCGTQLYRPFVSSFQETPNSVSNLHHVLEEIFHEDGSNGIAIEPDNYRLLYASSRTSMSESSLKPGGKGPFLWTPKSVLTSCLEWQMHRPAAPPSSIAHYYHSMALAAVSMQGGESVGQDGMYESYKVVQAVAPEPEKANAQLNGDTGKHEIQPHKPTGHHLILDATKGAFVLGSSIILLPFRLMRLVFGVIASSQKGRNDHTKAIARKFSSGSSSRTRDVLWLSESILSDLGSCLLLLLVKNYRNRHNAFRNQLARLVDNRWEEQQDQVEGLPDLPQVESNDDDSISVPAHTAGGALSPSKMGDEDLHLSVNFERLFVAYSKILHTEVGALLLYTLWQTSPVFAQNLVVRSDVDTLVLPLLRTLYFASNATAYMSSDFGAHKNKNRGNGTFDLRTCPFRSQSQLYVNSIILLLFSQDTSFGRDIFRRITVSRILWYKERNLRNINLGSVFILTVLRSLMFNLHRMQDIFLFSNCCAILQNISPSVVDLHDYAAMRLASVTVGILNKHAKMKQAASTQKSKDGNADLSSSLGMYEEAAHTLLGVIRHSISSKNIERNLHLVYALVYHQVDLNRVWNDKDLYPSKLTNRIQSVVQEASRIVQHEGARTAAKALNILEDEVERLQEVSEKKRNKKSEFTFAYEEEADPEIFFVPYVWETMVSVVTSSTIEWKKDRILVFPLLDPIEDEVPTDVAPTHASGDYSPDVDEVV